MFSERTTLAHRTAVLQLAATCATLTAVTQALATTRVAYLNVSDGTTALFAAAQDDAVLNQTAIATVVPYPAFTWPAGQAGASLSTSQAKAYLLLALHKAFLPYNLLWTDVRPARGPYTMVMVGGDPEAFGFDSRVAGVAVLDCEDAQASNIVFAFPGALPGNLHGLFVTAAQETAHAFGLEHTQDEEDIMHGQLNPRQWTFPDRQNAVSAPRACGGLVQNSGQKLLSVLGAWPSESPKPFANGILPDIEGPVITIQAPAADRTVASNDVVVSVLLADESEIDEAVFQTVAGARRHAKPPRGMPLAESFTLPSGSAKVVVWARDAYGNQGFTEVNFVVDDPVDDLGCRYAASSQGAAVSRGIWLGGLLFVAIFLSRACRRRRR